MSRGNFKINRQSDLFETEGNVTGWLKNFADSQSKTNAKTVVDVSRERNAQSLLQQIVSIIGKPPRYASVEDAVSDMRERTGLNKYLEQVKSSSEESKKKVTIAFEVARMPECLAKYTNVAESLENFIRNNIRNGHALSATIPQLQHDILSVFGLRYGLESQDVMNNEVAKYLNDCILEERMLLPAEIPELNVGDGVGRTDIDMQDNQDALKGLLPAAV